MITDSSPGFGTPKVLTTTSSLGPVVETEREGLSTGFLDVESVLDDSVIGRSPLLRQLRGSGTNSDVPFSCESLRQWSAYVNGEWDSCHPLRAKRLCNLVQVASELQDVKTCNSCAAELAGCMLAVNHWSEPAPRELLGMLMRLDADLVILIMRAASRPAHDLLLSLPVILHSAILESRLTDSSLLQLPGQLMHGTVQLLGPALASVPLASLDLSNNDLGTEGARALADQLTALVRISALDLSANCLGPDSMDVLAPRLRRLTALRSLNLAINRLQSAGVARLAPTLARLPLDHLNLCWNECGADGVAALMKACEAIPAFAHLDLRQNTLERDTLSTVLPRLTALTGLSLPLLNIPDPSGIQAISAAINSMRCIRSFTMDESSAAGSPSDSESNLSDSGLCTEPLDDVAREELEADVPTYERQTQAPGIDGGGGSGVLTSVRNGLVHLELTGCAATSQRIATLAAMIRSAVHLTHLCLSRNNLGAAGADALARHLGDLHALQHLDLSCCSLASHGALSIARALSGSYVLTLLDLHSNGIPSTGSAAALSALCPLPSLKALHWGHNAVAGAAAAEALAELAGGAPGIVTLDLEATVREAAAAVFVAASLPAFDRLRRLRLPRCSFGGPAVRALAANANALRALVQLDLGRTVAPDDALAVLVESLTQMAALEELVLGRMNGAGAGGVGMLRTLSLTSCASASVARGGREGRGGEPVSGRLSGLRNGSEDGWGALPRLDSVAKVAELRLLTKLSFQNCLIGPDMATAMLSGLVSLSNLEHLTLNYMSFGDEGVDALGKSFWNLPALRQLSVVGTDASMEALGDLAEELAFVTTLQELDLSENDFGPRGAATLAWALQDMLGLRELRLCDCCILDTGAAAVAAAIADLTSLRSLEVWDNDISEAGQEALQKQTAALTCLMDLGIA